MLVAAAGNGGAAPPDLSVMAKARHDGANYIYSLLSGYRAPPAGLQIREGQHYNPYMAGDLTPFWTGDHDHVPPGGFIAMPPPLQDGQVTYDDGAPQTVDQYSKDVAAFIAWSSEPKMVERKQAGFGVMIFLLIFAGLTAYDTQNIKNTYLQMAGSDRDFLGKTAIMGALQLYLDFLNLFMFLLQFMGNRE